MNRPPRPPRPPLKIFFGILGGLLGPPSEKKVGDIYDLMRNFNEFQVKIRNSILLFQKPDYLNFSSCQRLPFLATINFLPIFFKNMYLLFIILCVQESFLASNFDEINHSETIPKFLYLKCVNLLSQIHARRELCESRTPCKVLRI